MVIGGGLFIRARATAMRTIIVLRCLGVVLLVAAGLKAYGLAVEPVGAIGWFSSSWVQFTVIELEVVLGLWLLVAYQPQLAWFTAIALFSLFAAVNVHQAWIGHASCGCFGRISLSPWYAFIIDLFALAGLAWGRPDADVAVSVFGLRFRGFRLSRWLASATVTAALFIGMAYISFGSPDAAIAHLRGERISIRPTLVDLGVGTIGESRVPKITVINRSAGKIRLIGGTSDCSCITTQDLPLTLAPGEQKQLSVTIDFPSQTGLFTRTAELITDQGPFRRLRFRLSGRATAESSTVQNSQ